MFEKDLTLNTVALSPAGRERGWGREWAKKAEIQLQLRN
jgi:hypothetical protein